MEKQETTRIITIADFWAVFVQHILPIVAAAVLCVAIVFSYGMFVMTPKYSSTSTLYILKQENSNDYVYTQSDFSLALNVMNDCTYMVKSHEVLDEVIDKLDLDLSYKGLYNDISIINPENTRILEVTVESDNATQAKKIVDEICRTASKKINDTMGVDQVNVYSKGTEGLKPSNEIGLTAYAVIGVITAAAVYVFYLIAFILDDKIKTEEDVEKYLGLSVLGEIPNSNGSKRKKGRNKGYYAYANKSNGKEGGKAK